MGETGQQLEFPTIEEIIPINKRQTTVYGGHWAPPHNLRTLGRLELLLDSIQRPLFGIDAYPGLVRKAAHLAYVIIRGHLFWDGCKRTGMHTMLYFLALNGHAIRAATDEFEHVALATAAGNVTEDELAAWIEARLGPYRRNAGRE